ncbi:hypothetical protein THAOC_10045 [Thalassiosira oceanica]|uniref:Uncharacterized protein n=1 Tax=Thalassiosira oceanica TaxID=159749 RepID=K0SUZ2_THAOC|nr:hypothetical protein THAOC_10045 [Thalassiosira oceanica]|eukprot:EJK68749.1 hypothetical protein THAOC_10045 [Thalassiosira oceanica]
MACQIFVTTLAALWWNVEIRHPPSAWIADLPLLHRLRRRLSLLGRSGVIAGKGTPPADTAGKDQKAQEKNIRIVNLNRMLRLLRGNLKDFDAMHALHPLDKTSFTDKNYERAVDEAANSAEDAGAEPDADDEDDLATMELDADEVRAKAARDTEIGAKPATYAEALKQTPSPKPKRDRRRKALAPLPTNAQAGDRGAAATEVRTQTPPQQQQKKKKKIEEGRAEEARGWSVSGY